MLVPTKSDRSSGFSGERPEAISLAAVSLRRQTACVLSAASSVGRNFLPAIIFLIGCFLAFATGTSWGTFGILIPIVVCDFCRDKRDFDDHFHLCMYGRSGYAGSLFSDFRYDGSWHLPVRSVIMLPMYRHSFRMSLRRHWFSFVTYIIAGFVQSAWIALRLDRIDDR